MVKIYNSVVREKHLQKFSKSVCLIIPRKWIEELDWTLNTDLIMEVHPAKEEIVISKGKWKFKKPRQIIEINNEETSDIINGGD